jgi:hypothetical protein
VLAAARPATAEPTTRPRLTLASNTTVITSPLNPDGTPNYVEALNKELARDITKDNNAAIPLVKALGPTSLHRGSITELLNALNLELPANSNYFTFFASWAKKRHDTLPEEQAEKPFDLNVGQMEDTAVKAPWKREQFPLLVEWLSAIAPALEQVTAGSKLPRLYTPLISKKQPSSLLDTSNNMPFFGLRSVANAFAIRAMLRLNEGDLAAAREDILTIHRLARLTAQQPFFIHALLAIAVDRLAFETQQSLLKFPALTPELAKTILADITVLQEMKPSDLFFLSQRYYILEALMSAVRGNRADLLAIYTYPYNDQLGQPAQTPKNTLGEANWDITLRHVNLRLNLTDKACRLPTPSQRKAALEPLRAKEKDAGVPVPPFDLYSDKPFPDDETNQRYLKQISEFLSRKPDESVTDFSDRIALFFTRVENPTEKAFILFDRTTATHRLTLLAAALKVHHLQHKTYPQSLDDLKPLLNEKIPLDPFTAKPFRYESKSPDAFTLSSAGENNDHPKILTIQLP